MFSMFKNCDLPVAFLGIFCSFKNCDLPVTFVYMFFAFWKFESYTCVSLCFSKKSKSKKVTFLFPMKNAKSQSYISWFPFLSPKKM